MYNQELERAMDAPDTQYHMKMSKKALEKLDILKMQLKELSYDEIDQEHSEALIHQAHYEAHLWVVRSGLAWWGSVDCR